MEVNGESYTTDVCDVTLNIATHAISVAVVGFVDAPRVQGTPSPAKHVSEHVTTDAYGFDSILINNDNHNDNQPCATRHLHHHQPLPSK